MNFIASLPALAGAQRVARAAGSSGRSGLAAPAPAAAAARRRRAGTARARRPRGAGAALLDQLVERQVEQAAAGLLVDQHLGRVAEHRLHHVEVEALARDAGRLLVLDEDLAEARRVALGALHDLGLVAVGLLEQPRRVAAGARHDVVGVGLALVPEALAVLAGLDRVVERRLHLVGRLHVLQRHLLHVDAGLVAVEHLLHQLLGRLGDLLAALVQHEVHLAPCRRPRGSPSARLKRDDQVGLADVEEVVLGALEVVLDRELDVDDVLVVGQHQRFLVDLVLRRVAVADLDRLHLREVDELDRLDRERQVPARAGLRGLGVLAEARDDAAAAFVDDVEAAREPDDQHQRDEDADAGERQLRAACRRRRPVAVAGAAAPCGRTGR